MPVQDSYLPRRWQSAPVDPATALHLAAALGVSPVTAQVLVNRGLTDPVAARAFITAGREALHDPLLLAGMDRLVQVVHEAGESRRPVVVYGDYDVDGICSTAILTTALRALGIETEYYIPNRFDEGYGLSVAALDEIAARGFGHVITVDCGISAIAEADHARARGVTLVITDHHEPGPELPAAAAVVNPRRPDCTYPFKALAGAGIAFKAAQALLGRDHPVVWSCLELVALATVADVVPLVGENRTLVREGLAALGQTRRPGLVALKEVAGLSDSVNTGQVGFGLAPRLNALGRMGDASPGVELLLTGDPDRATQLARSLDEENQRRQAVTDHMLAEAMELASEAFDPGRDHALVLASPDWHPGVIGICAAKVAEVFYRPAVLLAIEGSEARGSARSIPGFHLYEGLAACSQVLTKFGGHAQAAGLSLPAALVPRLRELFNQVAAARMTAADLVPRLELDAWVDPEEITPELARELACLEPFGSGNPAPVLAIQGARVSQCRPVGRDRKHLKLQVAVRQGARLDGIGFRLAPALPAHGVALTDAGGLQLDLAFVPEMNVWNGQERLQIVVRDLRPASAAAPDFPLMPLEWDPLAPWAVPAGARAAGARRPSVAAVPPSWRVVDRRAGEAAAAGAEAALAAILESLAAGQRLLVMVGSPWAAAGVARALGRRGRSMAAAVTASPALPAPAGAGGCCHVACWGDTSVMGGGPYDLQFWLHPPYHLGQVQAAGHSLGPEGQVHLAWDVAAWSLAGQWLDWLYPDRDGLAHLYRLLRSGPAAHGPAAVGELAGGLAGDHGGMPALLAWPWYRLRIAAAAQVLSEVGLAEWEAASGRLRLLPAPGRKLDLAASRHYVQGQLGRQALADCRSILEAGSPGMLFHHLASTDPPEKVL